MTTADRYHMQGSRGLWAVVSLEDGLIYEGIVESEMPYGIYLLIGGDSNRLNLFPWHSVTKISYRNPVD